jgi:hypothetical protein
LIRFSAPIPWSQVIAKTMKEIDDDNCLGLAAQLSFYFLLGLFPALLFFVALVGYVPLETALSELLAALGAVAPQELVELLRGQLAQISEGSQASVLTLGVLGAIWSTSAAMVAIINALNRAFDVAEWRPWWKRRSYLPLRPEPAHPVGLVHPGIDRCDGSLDRQLLRVQVLRHELRRLHGDVSVVMSSSTPG